MMLIVTVSLTPAQAQHLAALVSAAQRAQQLAQDAVTLLAMGLVPDGAVLTHIDTDTGACTFTDPVGAACAD
jgi:hypothetical protein